MINDTATLTETANLISFTNGYLRDYSFEKLVPQKKSAIQHVFKNWPVADHITGSFSTLILDKTYFDIVITSDLCNIYPLYYLLDEGQIYISNSLILIGRYSAAQQDKTGIMQRAIGPNFCNIGSRTILKDCKRLLPGEWIKINNKGKIIEKKFDNSLYQKIEETNLNNIDLENYWNQYKKEVSLCTQGFKEVNIALSGGIDSRIALGAIVNKNISAYTFGSPKNYESKVAARLAKKKGAKHIILFDPNQYFPKKNLFYKYTRETEAVNLNSWLEILTQIDPRAKKPIILGELCEALPGRNIQKLNTGQFRKKNFYKYYVKNENIKLTPGNPLSFKQWKNKKMNFILSWHVDFWFDKLNFTTSKKRIIKETIDDAEEIFRRIESHHLPFTELYDELFSWYTYTRMILSRQVNICNEKFYAFSPGMSMQMLKKTSNIHPNQRLYYRFANTLLKTVPELKGFGKIPTSQIPVVPQNSNNLVKIPIWAIRSKIDDWLIIRMMSNKDINMRYRLLPSINWAKVYQQDGMLENILDYYENNQLDNKYSKVFYSLAENRKNLIKWPFANMDIISGATLNAELDLIKNQPE
ncbi:asparagine synthase-related protein [Christiangramia sp.]|uniref:asparagine synthase-related protein n=1 Tax=Christiangramia sp. TaxID=1931228 RepID=UPI0026350C12|nr:asparagine synthase-related protein [Christiangramia sp.]